MYSSLILSHTLNFETVYVFFICYFFVFFWYLREICLFIIHPFCVFVNGSVVKVSLYSFTPCGKIYPFILVMSLRLDTSHFVSSIICSRMYVRIGSKWQGGGERRLVGLFGHVVLSVLL